MQVPRTIPSVFGDGLLGLAMTGLIRIPAFMATCTSVMMMGELTIRGLSEAITFVGFRPENDHWIARSAARISESGIRPYKDLPAKEVALKAVAFAALGIIASEFIRLTSGRAPSIYNHILIFLGPLRISPEPYLDGVLPFLQNLWTYLRTR